MCNPGVGEKNKALSPPDKTPSIYVGETSKSLYERGKQHWKDFKNKHEDSHILKHHQVHHGGRGEPSFHLRPVRYFKTALTRQIAEAVLIQRWGEDRVLNSKAEFNRCKISRLTLGEEDDEDKWRTIQEEYIEDESIGDWERTKATNRRTEELIRNIDVGRGVMTSPANKRLAMEDKQEQESTTPKRTRKLKYPVLSTTWGEEERSTESTNKPEYSESTPQTNLQTQPTKPPPSTKSTTPSPPPTQSKLSPTTQYNPPTPSPIPDHSLLSQGRYAQGFPPVQLDPSEGHLHAGDLGDVTLRGGTVTSLPPLPHRPLPVDHPPLTGPNMEDNLPDRRQPHGITVNGIPLMDLLKNKKGDVVKKSPGRQKNNKNKNNTSLTTPQAEKITRYFENKKQEEDIKKQEDKNNIDNKNVKKTFSSTADSMREREREKKEASVKK